MTEITSHDKEEIDRGGQFLTFFLGIEEFGLEILTVQEIIGVMEITPVPRTPDFIRGVINLRGKVIPVIELRTMFDMETMEDTNETCIIVVQVKGLSVGLVVDRVSEVTDIRDEEVEEAPSFGTGVDTDYILGIGKSEERVRMLLDINQVLDVGELAALQQEETAPAII